MRTLLRMILLFGMLIFVPSICTAAMASGCAAPPSGLVSWWGGDNTPLDIMGVNNGTLVNGATFSPSGMVGQAFSFDGVNDYVQVADSATLDITNQITIDAWIKPSSLGGRVVDKITAGQGNGYLLDTYDSRIRFIVDGTSVSGGTSLTPGVWTHIAATYDGSSLKVYLNGVLDGTVTPASPPAIPTNNLPLRIGADSTGGSRFTGLIDEVEIFNRALTQSEIASIHDAQGAGKCRSCQLLGLTSWWGGDGNTADVIGGKNGTLMNGATYGDGIIGQAFRFDGSNDYVDLPDGFADFTTGLSVGVWAKPTASGSWARFIDFGNGEGNNNILFSREGGTNNLVFEVYDGFNVSGGKVIANGAITNNEWHYYAATQDSSGTVKLYKDGQLLVTSGSTRVPNNVTRVNNYIGRSNWGQDTYYAGSMDEVVIFNRALTAEEIATLYQSGNEGTCSRNAGLVGYWSFNQGNAMLTAGTANNGTPRGAATFGAGISGSAAVFGGVDNPGDIYVPNSSALQFTTGATYSAWVRVDNLKAMTGWGNAVADGSGHQTIFAKSRDSFGSGATLMCQLKPSHEFNVYILSQEAWGSTSAAPLWTPSKNVGDWAHVAFTLSPVTGYNIYVDGALYRTLSTPVSFGYMNNQNLYIGKFADSWYPFYGAIDEFRVYNRVLSGKEIISLSFKTVSFESNGGSAVNSQTVSYNTAATQPTAPTRTGYTFAGWYSDSDLLTVFNFATPITTNTTLYAKWTLNSYTVSFNSNGGSAVSSQTVDPNATASQPTAPTRTGYTFAGWYADSGLTTAFSFATAITADRTIYAKWTINIYTVSFESNGGSAVSSQTVNYNATVTEPVSVRTGYTLVDWYPGVSMVTPFDFATPITAPLKLYAKWAENTYKVTIVAGVGSSTVPVNHKDVEYGDKAAITVTPNPGYGILSVEGCNVTTANNTLFTTGAIKQNCTVVVTAVKRSGNGGTAANPSVGDALKVYQAYSGTASLTSEEKIRYDVAPLDASGIPKGNGLIDMSDVFMILRRSAGIGTW